MRAALCIVSAILGVAWSAECDGSDLDNWGVDFVGKSTKFEYYSLCDKDKSYIRIEMEDLIEYAADGKETKNKVTSFSSKDDYTWDTDNGTESTYQGMKGMANTFRSVLTVDGGTAKFNLTTILFQESGTVEVEGSDETVEVSDFTLKFSASIDDWPWTTPIDEDSTLTLCMKIETKEVKTKDKSEEDGDKGKKMKSYVFGDNVLFESPTTYGCGNGTKNVSTTIEAKSDLKKISACFTFDHCGELIDFDPFLSKTTDSAASNSVFIVFAFMFYTLFVQ